MVVTTAAHPESRHPSFRLLFAILSLLAAGSVAAWHVASWPDRLRYPGELDSVEGRILADMVMLREGEPVYAPATSERYNSLEYGPLFYLLGSRLVDPQQPGYLRVRLVAMIAALGLAAGCGLLAWWLSRSLLAASLAPLLVVSNSFVTTFGVSLHCDTGALLLWFWGFLIAYRFRDSAKVLLSVPLMTLGVFYKGQFLAGLLAVLCFLLFEGRFRLAAWFGGLFAGGVLSLFLLFQFVVYRGQAFWLHSLAYNAIPFSLLQGIAFGLIVVIVLIVPGWGTLRYLRASPSRLLSYWFNWALLLTFLLIAKMGSSVNYSLELLMIVYSLFSALLAREMTAPRRGLIALGLLAAALWTGQIFLRNNGPQPEDFAEDRVVQTYLRSKFQPHAVALGEFTGDLLRAGLDAPIANLYQYTWLSCAGKLPADTLVRQIERRRFQVILLNQNFLSSTEPYRVDYMCLTEPLRQAVIQNYRLDATFAFHIIDKRHYYAWVPR